MNRDYYSKVHGYRYYSRGKVVGCYLGIKLHVKNLFNRRYDMLITLSPSAMFSRVKL